jgi:hypothetical protein
VDVRVSETLDVTEALVVALTLLPADWLSDIELDTLTEGVDDTGDRLEVAVALCETDGVALPVTDTEGVLLAEADGSNRVKSIDMRVMGEGFRAELLKLAD